MALDSQAKRMSAVGIGRPWLRSHYPASISVGWRASIALSYAGITTLTVPLISTLYGTVNVLATITGFVYMEEQMTGDVPVKQTISDEVELQ